MAETYIYDGSTHVTKVRDQTVELTESASAGQVGNSRLVIEDAAGNTTITGHKTFRVHQDQCSVINVFRGFVGDREYNRAESERTQTARHITLTLLDLNAKLGFKIIRGSAWRKRPKETIGERLTDMLAASFMNGIHDNGFVQYPDYELDGGDLRGQFPGDVIAEMAEHVGFNWFIYWDEAVTEASLWFQDSNTSTDWSSTLRISDVAADVDGTTTFAPAFDSRLSRSPGRTVSGVWLPFKKGNVYRTRAATEDTYEPRDGTAPNANVKRRRRARNLGDRYLRTHSSEEDTITTTMRKVPDTKVNLARAGQRIEAKFTSFTNEGYGDFTWFRITERTVRPLVAEGSIYDIDMILSPQEDAAAAPDCEEDLNAAVGTISADHDRHEWDGVVGFPGGDGAFFEFDMFGPSVTVMNDGDPLTESGIRNGVVINGSNQFRSVIYSDLGAPYEVTRHLLSGSNYLDDLVHMTFESSDDASVWTPIAVSIAPVVIDGDVYTEILFDAPVTARYFSLVLTHVGVAFDGINMNVWQIRGCQP